jgi:hypothetical protein
MPRVEVPLLLLCGASGAGKIVGWMGDLLQTCARLVPVAHVDLDGIGYGPSGHFGSFEWRSYADVGAHAFIVSGLRALREDVEACTAAAPQSAPTVVVLTLTAEEQRERIVSHAQARYALERGGGSSAQTPEALERVVAAAAKELKDEIEAIPGVHRHSRTVCELRAPKHAPYLSTLRSKQASSTKNPGYAGLFEAF